MRARLGRIVAYAPADTWFFLGVSAFAAVLMLAYWFWTYEWAGTILLFGFALASGLNGLRLLLAHPPRRGSASLSARRPSGTTTAEAPAADRARAVATASPGASGVSLAADGEPAAQRPDADRPFLDERGRLPAPSIAPFAIALAAALVTTSIVLGPWLLIIAVLPLAWGAIGWLRDAGAEYRAIDAADAPGEADRDSGALVRAGAPSAGPGRLDRPETPRDAPSRP